MELYKLERDSLWIANINGNLGLLLLNNQKLEEAEPKIRDALDYYEKKGHDVYKGYGLLNLGNLLNEKGEYDKSIPIYFESLQLVPESVNPLVTAAALSGIGVAYSRLNQFNKAEQYLIEGMNKSKVISHNEQLKVCHEELSILYKNQDNYKKALFHYQKYSVLKDSIFTLDQDAKMIEALTKYESEKKEKEIALLNSQNETAKARIQGVTRFALLLAGALIILSFLIYRLSFLNKIVKQSNSEKETLLKEIHHRVKNNLQVISALLTLQSKYIDDDRAIEALREGQDRVQSMALIHRDLYQHDNLKGVKVKDYLDKLINSLLNSYKVDQNDIRLTTDIEDLWLDVDTMIPLGLMINELVSNVLKHAFVNQVSGNLKISLHETDNTLNILVQDDGKGVDITSNNYKASFGQSLIQSFSKKLKADVTYVNDGGLTVKLKIKNYTLAA